MPICSKGFYLVISLLNAVVRRWTHERQFKTELKKFFRKQGCLFVGLALRHITSDQTRYLITCAP